MPDSGTSLAPKVARGAFVQIVPNMVGFIPNIIVFQYNPERLTHELTPWNPFETDQTQRGAQAPTVQPFNPRESFSLVIELDAADDLEDGNPIAILAGVADRLAALKKLALPSQGPLGDLIASANALAGKSSAQAHRPTVPIVLFVWGPGRIVPVRITSFSVEESLFSPTLHPLQAKVTLALEVLTPDVFKCQRDPTAEVAVAAYNFTKVQEDALAVANIASSAKSILSILPI